MPNPIPNSANPAVPAGTELLKGVDLPAQVAAQLWSEGFLSKLDPQLSEVRSLEKQTSLVMLASTIPQDSTRTILAKLLLERSKKESPKALDAAGCSIEWSPIRDRWSW